MLLLKKEGEKMEVKSMDTQKKYTIADVEKMNGHVELINGELVIENKTTPEHNEVMGEIEYAIRHHIKTNRGSCKVFTESIALYVNEISNAMKKDDNEKEDENTFFLPDVMVVCETDKIDKQGVHTTPLFIAEVTSEDTKVNDYNIKLDKYKKIGVDEYWIVDIQRGVVYKYLKSENYIPQTFMHPKDVEVSVYNGLSIDLSVFM